ncbi:endonuclease domain-containing protein [Luteimonas yindakuii]|uniref:Endonuclease domain-containing protein n=1 Tax=Luteimonas yindakuii TaxID=2565782 RepID=A0A4Z1R2A7_9GAMM|nr:endonuclease domain-containing protein [Luteimonas yindakuii]TKS53784.1 endonuclease domain-containing protein [Luteimonas yindakuii]
MQGQTNPTIIRGKLPRALRNRPTDAEHRLWQYLRGRQLAGCKFRRQHPFGDYIVDFACLDRRVVVELDGGQHAERQAYDLARTLFLEKAGFRVLRFWNHDVFDNPSGIIEVIMRTLHKATPSPPNPPLEGEG